MTVIKPSSSKAVSVSEASLTSLGLTLIRRLPGTVPVREVCVVPNAAIRAIRAPLTLSMVVFGILIFRTV